MIGLNQLRTGYAHAPLSMRRIISPILSLVPERFRFGSTYAQYRKYIARSRDDLDFVSSWRLSRLRALIRTALTHSPHYQDVAKNVGLNIEAIDEFEVSDLQKFPILSRADLQAGVEGFLTAPLESLTAVNTGGTTETPLEFYLDNDRSVKEWAFMRGALSDVGLRPRDTRVTFRGLLDKDFRQRPWEFELALNELRLSPFHLNYEWIDTLCNLIQVHDARCLHGYPSAISTFANCVIHTQQTHISNMISGVLTVSEPLYEHQRSRIAEAFPNARIQSTYGLSEKVLFGSENQSQPDIYDLEPLYGIAELVDEQGQPLTEPGAVGRLVGTGLLFHGMPLIRYFTGDVAELVEPASSANLFRMKIKTNIRRWWYDVLVGSRGETISVRTLKIHPSAFDKMLAFQFRQTEPGLVHLKAIPLPGCSKKDLKPFIDEMAAKIGPSVTFDIELVETLNHSPHGRIRFIEQKLDLSGYQ